MNAIKNILSAKKRTHENDKPYISPKMFLDTLAKMKKKADYRELCVYCREQKKFPIGWYVTEILEMKARERCKMKEAIERMKKETKKEFQHNTNNELNAHRGALLKRHQAQLKEGLKNQDLLASRLEPLALRSRSGMSDQDGDGSMFPGASAPPSPQVGVAALKQQLESASFSSEERKALLGEALFPLISKIEPVVAGKITGMLLEMNQSKLLNLLKFPESLWAKVQEGAAVLKEAGMYPQSGEDPEAAANGNAAEVMRALTATSGPMEGYLLSDLAKIPDSKASSQLRVDVLLRHAKGCLAEQDYNHSSAPSTLLDEEKLTEFVQDLVSIRPEETQNLFLGSLAAQQGKDTGELKKRLQSLVGFLSKDCLG